MANEISDARELLRVAELRTVVYHAVRGKRQDKTFKDEFDRAVEERRKDDLSWSPDDDDPVRVFNIATRVAEDEIGVRSRIVAASYHAEFEVDAEAVFTLTQPASIAEKALQEFVERVGVMAIYPYLRSSIASLAAQLAVPGPTLRLLRSGDFQLTAASDSDD